MVETLTAPEVIRCYFENGFDPHLPAMDLRWQPAGPSWNERIWYLPEGVCLIGPAPERFGITIQRKAADAYAVRLLWDRTCLSWGQLTRAQLLTSALTPLLGAMGTDLWYLLDQPIRGETTLPNKAA